MVIMNAVLISLYEIFYSIFFNLQRQDTNVLDDIDLLIKILIMQILK